MAASVVSTDPHLTDHMVLACERLREIIPSTVSRSKRGETMFRPIILLAAGGAMLIMVLSSCDTETDRSKAEAQRLQAQAAATQAEAERIQAQANAEALRAGSERSDRLIGELIATSATWRNLSILLALGLVSACVFSALVLTRQPQIQRLPDARYTLTLQARAHLPQVNDTQLWPEQRAYRRAVGQLKAGNDGGRIL